MNKFFTMMEKIAIVHKAFPKPTSDWYDTFFNAYKCFNLKLASG